jgi:bifunctional enzyme CysN/CysC
MPVNEHVAPPPALIDRLAIAVVGHVDHGKSTLIGRLLFDTGSVPDGKAESIRQACAAEGMEFEYAFLMDALLEEQAQNITIDTTRIPFRTARREYAIIDTPGHREFLKNMVTGAASASAALVLIDAVEGIGEQSRRHASLLSLLGISEVIVLINKMDLCGYAQARYGVLVEEYARLLGQAGIVARHFIPIAAKMGDNIRVASPRLPWWRGPSVLEALDALPAAPSRERQPLRFLVQDVYRFDDRRIVAGRVESGALAVGDSIIFSPGDRQSIVKSIERWPASRGTSVSAHAGESLGITLVDPLFIERGAIGTRPSDQPCEGREFTARLFWMAEQPLRSQSTYTLRLGTQTCPCELLAVRRLLDSQTLDDRPTDAVEVQRHDIAEVTLRMARPIAFDSASHSLASGRFVLFAGSRPAGGGIVLPGNYWQRHAGAPKLVDNLFWAPSAITHEHRAARNGHPGLVVWFTGLSAAGKTTIAMEIERQLFAAGKQVYLLDGDNLRHGLCAGLGFSAEDRRENLRRAGEVARLLADVGVICLAAFISPVRADRERVRQLLPPGRFIEVHVATPLDVCRQRDTKGLYARAERGEIRDFTGVSAPYEAPQHAEITLCPEQDSVETCAGQVFDYLAALSAKEIRREG